MPFLSLFFCFAFVARALSAGQNCTDTFRWMNRSHFLCSDYSPGSCCSYVTRTSFFDQELAGDGKRWFLWFVSVVGIRACEVRPDLIINPSMSSSFQPLPSDDGYRSVTSCSMKCQSLPIDQKISLLTNFTSASIERNWTVSFNISWTIIIPDSCYPLYFVNLTNNSMNMNRSTWNSCRMKNSFNWDLTIELPTNATIQIVRYQRDSSVFFNLTSLFFHYFTITCQTSTNETTFLIADSTEFSKLGQILQCNSEKLRSFRIISSDCYLNNGICISTDSSYKCLCSFDRYTGIHCEIDIRFYQRFTCCEHRFSHETNLTSFNDQCEPGYHGKHCESMINLCENVTCQNGASCRSSLLNFTCECTSPKYSGRYCQTISSTLTRKTSIKRSLAYVLMITLVLSMLFIIILDLLKYVFGIDPIGNDYRRIEAKKRLQKKLTKRRPAIEHYVYVNRSYLETIPEE